MLYNYYIIHYNMIYYVIIILSLYIIILYKYVYNSYHNKITKDVLRKCFHCDCHIFNVDTYCGINIKNMAITT